MSGTWRRWVLVGVVGLMGCRTTGTAGREGVADNHPRQVIEFDAVTVTADLDLEKLNDEELFAVGTAAFAAEDFKQAARFFGRLADFHPQSSYRREALYNAGLAHERLAEWESAYYRFIELADPEKGQGDALDATFRVAETLYHQERFDEAAALLARVAERQDISVNYRIEARVQQGICEHKADHSEQAEATLRKALGQYQALADKDEVGDYLPAQAHFYVGEIYRLRYEAAKLDASKGVDKLAVDLEEKSQLLLKAQGYYLQSIRVGNGEWITASGAQIGLLYENMYEHMVNAPVPPEFDEEEAQVYRQEVRKKIRMLLIKSINFYEQTLEAAERTGSQNEFVERTRENLRKVQKLLLADAEGEPDAAPPPQPGAKPHS
jgi:TolA-binding protein